MSGVFSGFWSRYPAIQTSLEMLATDRDDDVAFFAKETLEGRGNGREGGGRCS